jgi:hypothetical protein
MKLRLALLSCGLACASGLPAQQVRIGLVTDRDQFLPGESLLVGVAITNFSGQPLRFGQGNDWVTFGVHNQKNLPVAKLSNPDVAGEFVIQSSDYAIRRVNLAPHFDLTTPGRYLVNVSVRIVAMQEERASQQPKRIEIVNATKLWDQEVGMPVSPGKSETRKFVLQQASSMRPPRLYLRVTDASESKLFKVFPLGQMVGFSKPDPQIDRGGNLHVLCQDGARSFFYCVANPDGELLIRQTHEFLGQSSKPRLAADPEGRVLVVGGQRRFEPTDIPRSDPPRAQVEGKSSTP